MVMCYGARNITNLTSVSLILKMSIMMLQWYHATVVPTVGYNTFKQTVHSLHIKVLKLFYLLL